MLADLQAGTWVEPTIWTGLIDDCTVVREEIFGLCYTLLPLDCEDDVIPCANDYVECCARGTPIRFCYTLCQLIAFNRFMHIFGGMKKSVIGRERGIQGLAFYAELKNVCLKSLRR